MYVTVLMEKFLFYIPLIPVIASIESLIVGNSLLTYVCLFHDMISSLHIEWCTIYLHLSSV